jgi:hypothetical protein
VPSRRKQSSRPWRRCPPRPGHRHWLGYRQGRPRFRWCDRLGCRRGRLDDRLLDHRFLGRDRVGRWLLGKAGCHPVAQLLPVMEALDERFGLRSVGFRMGHGFFEPRFGFIQCRFGFIQCRFRFFQCRFGGRDRGLLLRHFWGRIFDRVPRVGDDLGGGGIGSEGHVDAEQGGPTKLAGRPGRRVEATPSAGHLRLAGAPLVPDGWRIGRLVPPHAIRFDRGSSEL